MGLSAAKIVDRHGMSSRPDYYSGCGNRVFDLDSEKLEKIYGSILVEHGDNAAKAFVNMVRRLEESGDVSATAFLVSLYELEASGWETTAVIRGSAALGEADRRSCDNDGRMGLGTEIGLRLAILGGGGETLLPVKWPVNS